MLGLLYATMGSSYDHSYMTAETHDAQTDRQNVPTRCSLCFDVSEEHLKTFLSLPASTASL